MVTVRQLEPMSKLEKGWMHKRACIEGMTIIILLWTKIFCHNDSHVTIMSFVDPFNLDRNLGGHLTDTSKH